MPQERSLFLNSLDLESLMKTDQIQTLSRNNETYIETAINNAIAEMESYLRTANFDTATIFAQRNENRNTLLVMYATDIALYHLYSSMNGKILDNRTDRYNIAKDWLVKISEGKLSINLPKLSEENGGSNGSFKITGVPKRRNTY